MARQNGDTHQESYVPTTIKAAQLAQLKAKRDTTIIGSTVSGKKVEVDTGRDLHIQSLQDVDNFKEHSKSAGFSVSSKPNFKDPTGSISASVGRIDSKWKSVTHQAGIYAGEDGYDIHVGNGTTLEGAVIKSEAPKAKNTLTTKSLEMKDIQNEAEYTYSNNGIGYNYYGSKKKLEEMKTKDKKGYDKIYNSIGLVPNLGVGSKGKASSTTQSAISDGILTVDGKEIDTKTINTNTENTLHQLDKIFDKKKIEERQELARLFAKNAFEEVHRLSDKYDWKDGSAQKVALHAAIGEIAAQLAGNPNGSGAVAAGINELAINKIIDKIGKEHPDQIQLLSAVLGGAVNKLANKSTDTGMAVSSLGTKHNVLHLFFKKAIDYLDTSNLQYNQVYSIETNADAGRVYIAGVGGMIGVLVDKFGGVYDQVGGDVSISDNIVPVGATIKVITFPNIPNDPSAASLIKKAVEGGAVSSSVTFNHISWSTGVAIPTDIESFSSRNQTIHVAEGASTTSNGISVSGSYSSYVGNLSDENLWGGNYNKNVMKYFNEHPNSGLELYNGPAGNLILIKRTELGVQQYDGYGHFFNSVGFDKYASKMYWRRY